MLAGRLDQGPEDFRDKETVIAVFGQSMERLIATVEGFAEAEMLAPFDRREQPLSELPLKVRLLEGRLTLVGRPDLVLGRPPNGSFPSFARGFRHLSSSA